MPSIIPTALFNTLLDNSVFQPNISPTQSIRPPIPPPPPYAVKTVAELREAFYIDHVLNREPLLPDAEVAALFLGPADGMVVRGPEEQRAGKENFHPVRGSLPTMVEWRAAGGVVCCSRAKAKDSSREGGGGEEGEGGMWGIGLADLGSGEQLENRALGLLGRGREDEEEEDEEEIERRRGSRADQMIGESMGKEGEREGPIRRGGLPLYLPR